MEVGLYGNVTYDADGYVNTSDLNRINNAVSGNDLRVWNVDSTIAYSSGVLSFDGVDLVLADEYTIFLNDGGTGKTTTPSRLARDYEDDNFKGVISAVYDGDAVIEVYVDEDNSVITDETVAEVEEAVSDAVVNADGAWGQNGDLGNYVAHGTWNSDGTKVTASFEQSAISTESNAITWDTARFLGSLHKNGATTIVYDGVTYVWDKDGGLQGSNWYDSSDKGLTTGDNANTLVKALADAGVFDGDETATATLTVDGVDAPHSSIFELAGHVGTVLQDPDGQFIGLTVGEDIAFALENSCTPQDEMHEITRRAAGLVGIENHLDYAPHELSGGQKQRVSLAGVMVDEVKILLFDEPLANLDPATGKQAIELIDTIQQKTDTTVLIIEHRLEDVLWRSVDRIVLVNEGRILADLRPDELLSGALLAENGIREPLYVTAMRYAGIDITPAKHPAHVDSVVLDDADTEKLRAWFRAEPLPAAKPAPTPLLEVKGLSFGYSKDRHTLSDVSFTIGKGEMVSIVGRNGAGKSTLSKLICGFETPDSGEIFFDGKDLKDENIRRRARHIGYVMQNPNQMISKTMIFDEVALGLQGSGLTDAEIRARVEDTLKVCGLYPFRNWPISALSFGQKKRVTIASVLVQDPELIILDEPTAGQDFRHYTDIMEFLRGLNAKGVTVVMITHDMHLMLEYTPRALAFCDGRLIADRSAAAILCDPALIEQAALKETSLYTLANRCGITPAEKFVERFIAADREVRADGC